MKHITNYIIIFLLIIFFTLSSPYICKCSYDFEMGLSFIFDNWLNTPDENMHDTKISSGIGFKLYLEPRLGRYLGLEFNCKLLINEYSSENYLNDMEGFIIGEREEIALSSMLKVYPFIKKESLNNYWIGAGLSYANTTLIRDIVTPLGDIDFWQPSPLNSLGYCIGTGYALKIMGSLHLNGEILFTSLFFNLNTGSTSIANINYSFPLINIQLLLGLSYKI